MSFSSKFPALSKFIGAWFPDADFEGLPDEEIPSVYKKTVSFQEIEQVQTELIDVFPNISRYWVEIGVEANRYFTSSDQACEWLTMIHNKLKE